MKPVYITLILLCAWQFGRAQVITGRIKDEGGHAVKAATVTLRNAKDSAVVKLGVSDTTGQYTFNIPTGTYFIDISHTGYAIARSERLVVHDTSVLNVSEIILQKMAKNLREVVVTARKPPIEVKADKIILNVEGTVNGIGRNALELLRKAPGVTVDQDGSLTLSGKNGVQVFIDGKPSPLTDKDLADYLRTMQSSGIDAIEIITNPSAKYEAAGNAGIINIRLKKNTLFGTNGAITAGYNIASFGKYNGGINLNHRDQHTNAYVNYNYSNGEYAVTATQFRQLADTVFNQYATSRSFNKRHTFKGGVDYFLNSRNTLGVMVNGTFANNTLYTNGSNTIAHLPGKTADKILATNNNSTGTRNNVNFNINYQFANTSGHTLNVDADYGLYHIRSDQYQPNVYYDATGDTVLYSHIFNIFSPSDIDIYSLKTDYEQNWLKGRLGIGAKSSFVKSANTLRSYNVFDQEHELDSLHTNDFIYRETISALYMNYNRTFKGWVMQAGVRMENTHISGNSTGFKWMNDRWDYFDSTFHKQYTNFFPSFAITLNKNPQKQWTVSYSYRIDRPAYRDLNPFEFKIDDYTSRKGNTDLQPQYTNSIGVSYLYKQKLTTIANYSHTKDVFTVLTDTTSRSKTFITKKNLASQDIISFTISYPLHYNWYSLYANINSYYTRYKANFGTGRTIDLNATVININTDHTISLGKGWNGQLTAFYASPSIIQGTYKMKGRWSIDAGVQKTVLKNMGMLSVSISDVFNTFQVNATSSFSGQQLATYNKEESRQLRINFSYRFGNAKVKAVRQRKTGVEEENKRTVN